MEVIFFCGGVFALFIGGGCLFGFLARLPVIKKLNISRLRLALYLGAATFVVFLPLLAYIYAGMMMDSYLDLMLWDRELIIPELWIHYLVPPPLLSNNVCFSNNEWICRTSAEILNRQTKPLTVYMYMLILALMPAICCAVTVRYITSDNRKEKVKS